MSSDELHSYVWSEFDSSLVEIVPFLGGDVAVYLHKCSTRDASPNEDAACLIEINEERGILAVADGVGGGIAGNEASRCVVESLVESCFNLTPNDQFASRGARGEIIDAIEFANSEILSWGNGAATTLTAIEVAGGEFRYFHVGDSGCMLMSNRGTLKFATVGHAPVAQAVAIGFLDSQDAFAHEDQNLISNCIGSHDMRIEIGIFQTVSIRDTLILASDGLFDNLKSSEIVEIMRKGDLVEQTEQLVEFASERMLSGNGKPDDLSVICYRQACL